MVGPSWVPTLGTAWGRALHRAASLPPGMKLMVAGKAMGFDTWLAALPGCAKKQSVARTTRLPAKSKIPCCTSGHTTGSGTA